MSIAIIFTILTTIFTPSITDTIANNDDWVIISYLDGTEIQGECDWYEDIEVDGEAWLRICIDGEIYEIPKSQADIN